MKKKTYDKLDVKTIEIELKDHFAGLSDTDEGDNDAPYFWVV
jgi:hypothetical protein